MKKPAVVEQLRRLRPSTATEDQRAHGSGTVLELDLTEPILTAPPADPVAAFRTRRRTHLSAVLDGLARAARDDDVTALIAKVGSAPGGLGVVQELRDAVMVFRESGKRTVAWAETFGEFGQGTAGYYLATAFGEIWLQESGDVGIIGLEGQSVFLADALDRLGVQLQLGQRYEFKNAANQLLETGFTDAHREALGRVVESSAQQIVAGIAAARGLDQARVRELVDSAPIAAADALHAGLVDRIGYRDEVYDALGATADAADQAAVTGDGDGQNDSGDAGPRTMFLARYGPGPSSALARKLAARNTQGIAVVNGIGGIRSGRGGHGPGGGTSMGSDTVAAAIRAAVRDDKVAAVVFRVDSPGGSYVASDTIRREVVRAREQGMPVIVSMGDVAGSGGYFVAMAADVIVASPGTVTGSIGVFGGKAVTERLFERFGVRRDGIGYGVRAAMFDSRAPFDHGQWLALQTWLDRVYDDFTAKVAHDRGLSREHTHDVARGRIWTGADARERGLVDELGGFADAVRIARLRAGLPDRGDFDDLRPYPKISPLERIRPPQSSESPTAAVSQLRLSAWGPFTRLAARVGLPADGPLTVPGWTVG